MFPCVGKVSGARASSMPSVAHSRLVCTELTWCRTYQETSSCQPNSAADSAQASPASSSPASSSAFVSVVIRSRSPTQIWWCCVAARETPPTRRCACGLRVEAAEHHRRRARAERQARELVVDVGRDLRRAPAGGRSSSAACGAHPSPSTIRAYGIWPASIAVAARWIALTKPRHALPRSKLRQPGREAEMVVDGAGDRRLEVVPADRGRDEHADLGAVDAGRDDRLLAGERRRLVEAHLLGPPAALGDAGDLLEQARAARRSGRRRRRAARRSRRR